MAKIRELWRMKLALLVLMIAVVPLISSAAQSINSNCQLNYEVIEYTSFELPVQSTHEPLWFGVKEAIVTGVNAMVWIALGLLLFSEFQVYFWARRSAKKLIAAKKYEESGADGYKIMP